MTEVSKEYGAALFMLACENGKKHEYAEALDLIEKLFKNEPEYLSFLASPAISVKERLAAINEAFASLLPEEVLSYLMLLCQKGRMDCFYDSAEEYKKLLAESERKVKAEVKSAVPLTEEEKKLLREKLEKIENREVVMQFAVDKSLIGGVTVEMDGKVLDGSVRSRLSDVKEVMVK